MNFRKSIRATFLILSPAGFFAQSMTAVFSQIGETQGLSAAGVSCMLQDSRGFLWIGTTNGLNCYDGKKFTVYKHSRFDSTSICDNDVRSLAEGKNGLIWMGTKNGVSCLN